MQIKSQQAQQDAQRRQNLMDRAIGTQETGLALDKYKHDSDLQYKYWKEVADGDAKEAEIVGNSVKDILLARESRKQLPQLPKPAAEKAA
jgi:hypothetical protein